MTPENMVSTRSTLVMASLLAGCALLTTTATLADEAGKTYGRGVTLRTAVPVRALLETPEQYVGKTVRVDGTVSAVCQHMGCWLEIADPDLGRGVRFKVQDGVIVFPRDAAGRQASAEGTFEEIPESPMNGTPHGDARLREADGRPAPDAPAGKTYWVRATGAVLR